MWPHWEKGKKKSSYSPLPAYTHRICLQDSEEKEDSVEGLKAVIVKVWSRHYYVFCNKQKLCLTSLNLFPGVRVPLGWPRCQTFFSQNEESL